MGRVDPGFADNAANRRGTVQQHQSGGQHSDVERGGGRRVWVISGSRMRPSSRPARISGVNSATLTISNLALADAGTYFVTVSNLFGATNSSQATLTVVTAVTITTKSSPAKVASLTGGGSYEGDSMVTVSATVTNDCYYFTNWTAGGKVVSTNPTYMFTRQQRNAHGELPAASDQVQTTSAPPNGGTITGGGAKDCGATVTIAAHAHAGFKFVNWMAGATVISSNASYKLTVAGDVQLTAHFADSVAPSIMVTTPTGTTRTTNATIMIAGKASDNVSVAGVSYILNNGAPISAQLSNNGSNWSAVVNLATGANIIQVYAVDTSNLQSKVKIITVIREPGTAIFVIDATDTIAHPQAQITFDGSNYLVAFQTGVTNDSVDVAQFVSPSGELVGGLLGLNPGGNGDPPCVAFDGTNYLTAWADYSDTQAGVPVRGLSSVRTEGWGSVGQLSQSGTVNNFNSLVFGGGVYFLMWSDGRESNTNGGYDDIYGAMITPTGSVAVSDFELVPEAP